MNSRLPRFAVACLSPLALCAFLAFPAHADSSVSVDFSGAHTFTGIGAQMWTKKGAHPQEEIALLRDINAKFTRVSVMPQLPDAIGTNLSVERLSQIIANAETPQQRSNIGEFRNVINQLQIKPHLVFWHMPEEWEEATQKKAGSKKETHKALAERLPDYANLLTAELLWVTKQGIEPYAVELTNEPQGGWDSKFRPQDYADLVLLTRRALDAHGLQRIRIEGPGTGVRNFAEFAAGLRERNAFGALAFLTAHVYQSPQMIADARTPGYAEFLGKGRQGEIVITEFGVKKHNEGDNDAAAADLAVDSSDYALATAAESLQLLGLGASSVIYWQLEDYSWSKKLHGLLDENGRRRPVAAAVQALYGKVPADSKTVAGVGGPGDVPIEGFAANGKVYLLMANLTDAPQAISARIAGVGAPRGVAAVDGFVNGALSKGTVSGAAVRDGVFTGTLAPRSLASVTLQ